MITSRQENVVQNCRASGRKCRGRDDKTSSLHISSTPAADSGEVNVIAASLQKMSIAAVDEPSSEEVLSTRPRPLPPEVLQCSNNNRFESLKDDDFKKSEYIY